MTIEERDKLVLETKKEVLEEIKEKAEDIDNGFISPAYLVMEIKREVGLIDSKLKAYDKKPAKVEVLAPEHGPGDEVMYTITDKSQIFTVMAVNHGNQSYKLKSKNLIKPITVEVGWGELDEV